MIANLLLVFVVVFYLALANSTPVPADTTLYQADTALQQADTALQQADTALQQADSGYQSYPDYPTTLDSKYKLHCKNKESWDKALVVCQKEDAHLVIINSFEEALLVAALFKDCSTRSKYLSVGITDQFSVGYWLTVQGQPLSQTGYTTWGPGEPNNVNGKERCGNVDEAGRLNDSKCSEKNIFVCEK